MDEDVLRAVIGRDEPVALVVAEPLDSSGRHALPPLRVLRTQRMHEATTASATHKLSPVYPALTLGTVAGSPASRCRMNILGLVPISAPNADNPWVTVIRRTLPPRCCCLRSACCRRRRRAPPPTTARRWRRALQELAKPSVRSLPRRPSRPSCSGIAASGPGILIREDGRVLVEARFDPARSPRCRRSRRPAAKSVTSRHYQLATVSVPYDDLPDWPRCRARAR